MSLLLYNLGIRIYMLLVAFAALFNQKAKRMTEGRAKLRNRLQEAMANNTSPILWFHCASLGEFEQGRPVLEALRTQYPQYKVMLTFFSPSGYEVRKTYNGADWIFYLPYDTASNARYFIDIVKPQLVFFIKYEFWYYYIKTLSEKQIPTFLISAAFRKDQLFFKPIGSLFRKILDSFTYIFVQNKNSSDLLNSIGVNRHSLSGDTRFDRVHAQLAMVQDLPLIESFKGNNTLIIAGSTWQEDMELLIPYINDAPSTLRFIVAPHEINVEAIEDWRKKISKNSELYSAVSKNNFVQNNTEVLFIDSIGLLAAVYRYGNYAHVGGAFGNGLHNILEAATFGMPISFGPNIEKFPEAEALISARGARSVRNEKEFTTYLNECLDPEINKRISDNSRNFIQQNRGATQIILNHIELMLHKQAKNVRA